MPRPSIGETPMTGAERQARYRAARANNVPVIRIRRARLTVAAGSSAGMTPSPRLTDLQAEYAAWLEAMPDNQRDSTMAEALRAIVELDLSELQAIEPPRGFGRD